MKVLVMPSDSSKKIIKARVIADRAEIFLNLAGKFVMKNTLKLLTFSFILMFASCVPSLNPFYTEQDLIFDAALLGVWTDKDSKETWELTKAGEKEYKLVYTDEDDKTGEFTAHLLKIDGKTFLDLTPIKPVLSQNDFYKDHFLSVHSFAQISHTAPTVQISFLEPEWVKKFLAKNPTAVSHHKMGNEILLIAAPKQLQKFLLAHLNTEGAFAKPISVKRK